MLEVIRKLMKIFHVRVPVKLIIAYLCDHTIYRVYVLSTFCVENFHSFKIVIRDRIGGWYFFRQTPLVSESRVLMFAQASNVIDTDLYCALLCTVASGNTSWLPNLSLRSVSATDS